jgi:LysM repeat protein
MKRTKVFYAAALIVMLIATSGFVYADTTHTIQRGDTLYGIALRYGTTVQAIVNANGLANPNLIYAGQTLIIPDGSDFGTGGPIQPPAPSPSSDPSPLPTGGSTYTIQRGDTLSIIAAKHGVTVAALIQANSLANPNLIFAGQTLVIPGGTGSPPASPPPAAPAPPPPPASPPPQTGPNLLPNPSFEGGYYHVNGLPELQVPNHWSMEFDDGNAAPETGITVLRPESRVLSKAEIPAHEHSLFFWNGDWSIKVFKGHAPIGFRLLTDVHLEPGRYRLVANYFPDLIEGYDSNGKLWVWRPNAGEVAFVGPGGGGYSPVTPGSRNTFVHEFSVGTSGTVRLGLAFRTRYAIPNSGFFIDDWSLERIS